MDYPPQVQRLHSALESVPGVTDVVSGIESLEHIGADDLRFAEHAALPTGALRRTGGGLRDEALFQFEFRIVPTASSHKTIEFLSWFVSDVARNGTAIQLRPFASPPQAAGVVQLGHTLRWYIEWFCPGMGPDLTPQLEQIGEIARTLELAMSLYGSAFSHRDPDPSTHRP